MKRIAVVAGAVAFACFVQPASTLAEEAAPAPEVTKFMPLVGHWVNEEEHRSSEDSAWEKASSEWDVRFAAGGFFVETPGRMITPDGELSWTQVWGYDPRKKAAFTRWYGSTGIQGDLTFKWDGRNIKIEGTDVMVDGSETKVRCSWTNAEDYESAETVCEQLTDGRWWIFRRVKGKKVE